MSILNNLKLHMYFYLYPFNLTDHHLDGWLVSGVQTPKPEVPGSNPCNGSCFCD
jgi:hypothetical protein